MAEQKESQFTTSALSPFDEKLFPKKTLTPEEVENLHKNADTDQRIESIHHTLGTLRTQAASGSHNHKDTGTPLFEGYTFTGSRSTNTASILAQILTMLEDFGAIDSTTA